MVTRYYIQDIRTKEYYWSYRIDNGFTLEIGEAYCFDSKEALFAELELDWVKDIIDGRFITIVEVLVFE